MTRQRRGGNERHQEKGSGGADRRLHRADENPSTSKMNWFWTMVMLVLLAVAAHLTYTGYLETRVTTRFDTTKARRIIFENI
jgi:hypothetical protein